MKASRNFYPTYSKYEYFGSSFSIKQWMVVNDETCLSATLFRGDDPEFEAGGVGGEEAREEPFRGVHLLGGRPALPLVELAEAVELREPPTRAPGHRRGASDHGYEQEEPGSGRGRQHRGGGGRGGGGGETSGSGEWNSAHGMTKERETRWLGD